MRSRNSKLAELQFSAESWRDFGRKSVHLDPLQYTARHSMVNIAANIAAAKHQLRRSDLFNLFQYDGTSSIVVLLALKVMVLILIQITGKLINLVGTTKYSLVMIAW